MSAVRRVASAAASSSEGASSPSRASASAASTASAVGIARGAARAPPPRPSRTPADRDPDGSGVLARASTPVASRSAARGGPTPRRETRADVPPSVCVRRRARPPRAPRWSRRARERDQRATRRRRERLDAPATRSGHRVDATRVRAKGPGEKWGECEIGATGTDARCRGGCVASARRFETHPHARACNRTSISDPSSFEPRPGRRARAQARPRLGEHGFRRHASLFDLGRAHALRRGALVAEDARLERW